MAVWFPAPMIRSPSQWPGDGPVLDLGGPFADHHHRVGEPVGALVGLSVGFAAGPAGAQRCPELAAQLAAALDVERLVDRLVAHAHALVVWVVQHEPVRDLLRGQLALQALLHLRTQRVVGDQLRLLGSRPGSRSTAMGLMGQVAACDAALLELARDRGDVLADPGRDRSQGHLVDQPIGDCQPVIQRQVAITDDRGWFCHGAGVPGSGPGVHDRAIRIDTRVAALSDPATPVPAGAGMHPNLARSPRRRPTEIDQLKEPDLLRALRCPVALRHQAGQNQDPGSSTVTQTTRLRGSSDAAPDSELLDDALSHVISDPGLGTPRATSRLPQQRIGPTPCEPNYPGRFSDRHPRLHKPQKITDLIGKRHGPRNSSNRGVARTA